MALDPRSFHKAAVTDTCSIWNMLSSRRLYQATITAKIHFCITPMVLYECLHKPRKSLNEKKSEMMARLERARRNGGFPTQDCDLDDLLDVARLAPKGLGSGELSCIATAYRIRSIAFMTDEKKARLFAERDLKLDVETTPKLYAWLLYNHHLGSGDHTEVLREHEHFEERPLTQHMQHAYEEAMRCQTLSRAI